MLHNRNLKTSKAPIESQAQGTSLLKSAAKNLGVVQGKFRSDFQRVRGNRVVVYGGCV